MLNFIRERAQGWIAAIIVGLLIIPFALWGINQYFGGGGQLAVATVNGTEITQQEFQQAFYDQRARMQQMLGAQYDSRLFDPQIKKRVINDLVDQELLLQNAADVGYRVGDEAVASTIRSIDAFKEDGVFSTERYQQALQSQGESPPTFESRVKRMMLTSQLTDGLASSVLVTDADIDESIRLTKQTRELRYLILPTGRYADEAGADEESIKAYYEKNASQFMTPEQVSVEYVELSAAEISAKMAKDKPPTEEQLKEYFEKTASQYSVPEERRARHILISVGEGADEATIKTAREKIEALQARIKAGESFEKLAKENSEDPGSAKEGGDLGYFSRGIMDPGFEKAAFALKVGEVSDPVLSSFGFHLIKLEAIREAKSKKFEDVREELIPEYQKDAAERRYFDLAEKLTNLAYESPDSLSTVADQLGLELKKSPFFASTGGQGLFANPRVVTAAFGNDVLTQGYNSEPVEVGENHVLVMRLLEHKEASQLPLEKVHAQVKKHLVEEKAREAAKKAGDDAVQQLHSGTADNSIAGKLKVAWKNTVTVARDSKDADAAIVKKAFTMTKPQEGKISYDGVVLRNGDYAIIALNKVTEGDPATVDKSERETIRRQLANALQANSREYLIATLRKGASIKIQEEDL